MRADDALHQAGWTQGADADTVQQNQENAMIDQKHGGRNGPKVSVLGDQQQHLEIQGIKEQIRWQNWEMMDSI